MPLINRLLAKGGQHKTRYLFFDGGQDVVGGGVSLHAAASCAVADGQQKPLLRHWALLRSWHSSCVDTHTHTIKHNVMIATGVLQEEKNK